MRDKYGRREFLRDGTWVLVAAANLPQAEPAGAFGHETSASSGLRFGLVTDLHYADKDPAGTRHYRETLRKLQEAGEHFRAQSVSFAVELGDFIDAADSVETERQYLARIDGEFSGQVSQRHYVLGNHCVDTLTKDEFLGAVGQARSYYSFDVGGHHFVVLDSCFRSDGTPYGRKNSHWTDANVPAAELEWLQADLAATRKPVIVLAHQRLDVSNHYGVKNNAEIRRLLESSQRVLAVFQGHSHKNDYRQIGGIHYCTVVAMVEGSGADNNGYCVVCLAPNGVIAVQGFRQQQSYEWKTSR